MSRKKKQILRFGVLCATLLSASMLFTACDFEIPGLNLPGTESSTSQWEAEVTGITLDASKAETVFDVNDEFTTFGLLVKASYADNTSKLIFAEDCEITAPDMTTRGSKTVTVTYKGKSAEYSIMVREFKDITIDASAVKTRFNANEAFDYNGLVVYANYYDDVASSIVTDYTVSSPDLSTFGEKTVTVTYNGQTAEYTVTVANAPAISSATLVEEDGKLYFKLTGTAQGFTEDQITLDLQEMFGAWGRVDIQTTASVNAADGTFEVLGNITDSAMTSGGDYMIHIFFAGESFDVVDIQNKADQTVTVGDVAYQIKSEQWFDNNTSYFVVLRCGNESDFSDKASFEVTSVSLEAREDKVYYVVNGNYAVYAESDFVLDVQETAGSWTTTPLNTEVTLDSEAGTFTLAGDVTEVLTTSKFISHIVAGKKQGNLMNYDGFTEKSVTVGGKTYTLNAQDVFGNGTDFYLVLTANAAEGGEQPDPTPEPDPTPDPEPVEKAATATSATIENREGKLYFVVSGTYAGYTEADFDFDVQESANAWATTDLKSEVTLDAEAGTFTLAADVSFMATSRYFSHIKVAGVSSDLFLNVEEKTVSVGIYNYTIKSEDIFSNGSQYVTITKTVNDTVSHSITSATIENREGKLYFVVSGTYVGYEEADFGLDVQEAANAWPTTNMAAEVTLNADAGTFTVAADISAIAPSRFMFKLKLAGKDHDVRDIEVAENAVTVGNYDYTIKIEDVYGDDKYDAIVVVYKVSKVTLSYTITSATIENREGKLYFVIKGGYSGYEAADFDMDIQENVTWGKTEVTPEVTLNEENGTYEMAADVTEIITGWSYFAHVILPGVYADVANIADVAEQSVTIENKTYTLKIVDLFANGAQVVTLSMTETEPEPEPEPEPDPEPDPEPEPEPVEKTATATSATIENREGKLYFVVSGTYAGYTEADFDFDVQESANAWATTDLTPEVTLDAEAGTFTLAADVSFMATSRYFSHIKIAGVSSDLFLNVEEKTVSVGIYNYTIKSEDIFSNGSQYVTITKTVNDTVSHSITSATIENREGKLYFVIKGGYSGYEAADFDMDIQENVTWGKTEVTPEVTLNEENGTYEMAADVTEIITGWSYFAHVILPGVYADVANIAGVAEQSVTIENKTYTLKIVDLFANGAQVVTLSMSQAA